MENGIRQFVLESVALAHHSLNKPFPPHVRFANSQEFSVKIQIICPLLDKYSANLEQVRTKIQRTRVRRKSATIANAVNSPLHSLIYIAIGACKENDALSHNMLHGLL